MTLLLCPVQVNKAKVERSLCHGDAVQKEAFTNC